MMQKRYADFLRNFRADSVFKQKTAYEITTRLVGSEMCIRDSTYSFVQTLTSTQIRAQTLTKHSPKGLASYPGPHSATVSYTHLTLPTKLEV